MHGSLEVVVGMWSRYGPLAPSPSPSPACSAPEAAIISRRAPAPCGRALTAIFIGALALAKRRRGKEPPLAAVSSSNVPRFFFHPILFSSPRLDICINPLD